MMSKTKWILLILVVMDIALIIIHQTDYVILFLLPTGYVIPIVINMIVFAIIGARSSRVHPIWVVVFLIVSLPILFAYGFILWFMDDHYAKVESAHHQQSLHIKYRHFTLGETTYSYQFYQSRFGLIGKKLEDQSIQLVIQGTEHPGAIDGEGALGLDHAEWITNNIVRFPTWKGMKEVHLNGGTSSVQPADIDSFIQMVEDKVNGEELLIHGNRLESRYDAACGQAWIDIISEGEEGAIPTQQCTRIVKNKERGYYMLEECTHQWEYLLYPLVID